MFAKTFIDRPVLAWVVSIVICLFGLAALFTLPIAQYPPIAPPTVQVSAVYPGANAKVVADTVAAPIEQQVNGVENMLYMSSQCTNDGAYNLTVTFKLGADLNMAQVLVQNRVSLATAQLPQEVQRQGLNVKKKSPNILMVVNVYSEDNSRDQLYLSNYTLIQLKDEIARLDGVGDVTLFGQQDYSMRAWLDPDRLNANRLTTNEVVAAIKEQNVQVAAGQIGQEPVPLGQPTQLTLSTLGRLTEVDQFKNIIVKVGEPDPNDPNVPRAAVRLADVARVELGAKNLDVGCTLDGKPSVGLAVFQLPGSNALDVGDRVKAKMAQLQKRFPSGVNYAIRYDTTPFIIESVDEVFNTLRDAIILVAIVVLLFLQDWKAMILPMIDVPVSLIGTLAVMYLLGFSLNNLTLFGLVLAIGIVVDDAIVVLENVERWIAQGYDSRTATIKAMGEITGPIIAITLVLSSVFLPSAFLPGITGQFYQQFALTIAVAMMISAVNAMTLTPSRAAAIFKNHGHGEHVTETLPWYGWAALGGFLTYYVCTKVLGVGSGGGEHRPGETTTKLHYGYLLAFVLPGLLLGFAAKPVNAILRRFYKVFNAAFDRFTLGYRWVIARFLRVVVVVLVVYAGLLFLTGRFLTTTPVGFIPLQDKGFLLVNVQLPDAASVQRTRAVMAQIEKDVLATDGVGHTVGISGNSVLVGANGSNFGSMFVILKPFDERHGKKEEYGFTVLRKLQAKFRHNQDAIVGVFPPTPVEGLGTAGGYKVYVEDRGDLGSTELQKQVDNLIAKGQKEPGMGMMFTLYRANIPQLFVDVDRNACKQKGVSLNDVFATLQSNLGSTYVNDFNRFGRTWQVNVQAEAEFRKDVEHLRNLKVRNDRGEMVSLSSVARIEDSTGPLMIQRYNMYPSAAINGNLPPGTSTGDGMRLFEGLAERELPKQMTTEWTELFYLQTLEGNSSIYAFVGAVILVFLVLAGMYDNWALPVAILLVVPMCILSALIGVRLVGLPMDIFVQIGFIVLVGLAAKNAILIVEFAEQKRKEGMPLWDATLESCQLRLRPIVMTSFAFILGVVPLTLAQGAGAEMRATLGIAVFSGMLGVTVFGVFLTPVFYYTVRRLTGVSATEPMKPEVKPDEHAPPGHPPHPPSASP